MGTLFPIRRRPVNERVRPGEARGEERGRGHGEESGEMEEGNKRELRKDPTLHGQDSVVS